MGRLRINLERQLKTEQRKDAQDCLEIYEALQEMDGGRVWESKWSILVETKFEKFPSNVRTYSPTAIGRMFLQARRNK